MHPDTFEEYLAQEAWFDTMGWAIYHVWDERTYTYWHMLDIYGLACTWEWHAMHYVDFYLGLENW